MNKTKGFLLSEINKPEDWNNLSDMAKKHVPLIKAPEKVKPKEPFKVKVKIGGIGGVEHPNMLGHWINWVELYAGERLISRIEFAPEISDGYIVKLSAILNESTILKARGYCNLHGVWEGQTKKVMVR